MIKELTYDEYIRYYDVIEVYLVQKYQKEFKGSRENVQRLIDQKLDALKTYLKKGNAFLIGAIEEDQLVGFIWLYQHEYFEEKRLHLNELMVKEDHRRKGIGGALLKEAENKALSLGIEVLDLVVSENNVIALNIYDKMGYVSERRQLMRQLD